MLDHGSGPLKYLVIAFVLVVLFQYMNEETKIDTESIANRDSWFEQHIYQDPGPVLLKFGAEWCPPCRSLDESLTQVAPKFGGRVKLVRVDVEENPGLASAFGVRGIPHSFILVQGRVVDQRRGGMDTDSLKKWLTEVSETSYEPASR